MSTSPPRFLKSWSLKDREGIRHAPMRENDEDAWFTPVVCGYGCGIGINLPGTQTREAVDCPQCLSLIAEGFAPDTPMPTVAKRPSRRHTLTSDDYAA